MPQANSTSPNPKALSLTITGRVQGVFFRKNTLTMAQKLGLRGFVKNIPDGSVYLEIIGDPVAVQKMVAWCAKGPAQARVKKCKTSPIDPAKLAEQNKFEIRY